MFVLVLELLRALLDEFGLLGSGLGEEQVRGRLVERVVVGHVGFRIQLDGPDVVVVGG